MEKHNYIFGGTDNRNTNIRVPIMRSKVEPSLFGAFRCYYYEDTYRVECIFLSTTFSLLNGNFRGERTGHLHALVASDGVMKAALMLLKLVVR